MLPSVEDMLDDGVDADAVEDLCEDERAVAAHEAGVAFHDGEVGADGLGEVGFVNDEEVGLGDAGTTFARDFVAASDVDDVDGEVCEFAAEVCGEVVAAGFDEEKFGVELAVEFFEGEEVGGDVFADGGVRAAAGFDGADAVGFEGFVAHEEFAVFFGEDVVGDGGDLVAVAQLAAEGEHQGGFAAADGSTHTDGECASGKVAGERLFASGEMAGAGPMFVGMGVVVFGVGVRHKIQL